MRNTTTRDKMEFTFLMAKHSKAELSSIIRLLRFGQALGQIAENQCNGYQKPGAPSGTWDGVAEDADRRKRNRIVTQVVELCATFECKPVFQGDPRGNRLKIQVPDGYTNDWGWEGICVPTS